MKRELQSWWKSVEHICQAGQESFRFFCYRNELGAFGTEDKLPGRF